MSLDASRQGSSKLLIVVRLGGEGSETQPQKSRLCEQATGRTLWGQLGVGEGCLLPPPLLPGCSRLCNSASHRLPEQQKRPEPFISADPWHRPVAAHISRVALRQAGVLAAGLCQDLSVSPVGLKRLPGNCQDKAVPSPPALTPAPPLTHTPRKYIQDPVLRCQFSCARSTSTLIHGLRCLLLAGPYRPDRTRGKSGTEPLRVSPSSQGLYEKLITQQEMAREGLKSW